MRCGVLSTGYKKSTSRAGSVRARIRFNTGMTLGHLGDAPRRIVLLASRRENTLQQGVASRRQKDSRTWSNGRTGNGSLELSIWRVEVRFCDARSREPWNWMQLETFVGMVEDGGVRGAAERVFRTQPAVSIAVSKLERGLEAPLFDRSMRHEYCLTQAGAALYEHATLRPSRVRAAGVAWQTHRRYQSWLTVHSP